MCGTTLFQNPATARTAGSCERIGATKAPVLSPAFFRPPVHFQKHGNPPTEVGPIVVGKPHVILPFDEKGQCRREVSRLFATLARQGPKAVVCGQNGCRPGLVRPTQRPTGANEGGIVGGSMTEKKGFFVDGVVIRVFSKSAFPLPIFRPLATKVGPGFCPELQPPYSWTRCLPTKKPGWSCTKNQQSRTSRPADFTQLPTWVQRSVPFT
jgi:hypothetical protein